MGGYAQAGQALACPVQLLGGQGHAHQAGLAFGGGHFGQCAPAAADFQHAVTGLDPGHAQGAAHLGVLGLAHGRVGGGEQGRRVVHGVVQPQRIEGVAQVVMGVDVFAAVGLGVAVEQVAQPVGQLAPPAAVHRVFHHPAVAHQHAQQRGEVGGGPVTGNEGFGKPDVARAQHLAAHAPVADVQVGMQFGSGGGASCIALLAVAGVAAIGPLHMQAAVGQALQQGQHGAGGGGCAPP